MDHYTDMPLPQRIQECSTNDVKLDFPTFGMKEIASVKFFAANFVRSNQDILGKIDRLDVPGPITKDISTKALHRLADRKKNSLAIKVLNNEKVHFVNSHKYYTPH